MITHGRVRVRWVEALLPLAAVACLASPAAGAPEPKAAANSCVTCHADPDFLVTRPRLYEYFQDWQQSLHAREAVSCSDCHGGRPEAAGKSEAHAGALGEDEAESAVNFANIPATCGGCHGDIEDAYRESKHFEHLVALQKEAKVVPAAKGAKHATNGNDKQGPSCVTCHRSMNTLVLDVTTVEAACSRCHNEKRDNHPEVPEAARQALNRFLSIDRLHRYVAVRMDPAASRPFLEGIDQEVEELQVQWHTFDLERIETATRRILEQLQRQRDEIRAARDAQAGSRASGTRK